ncbi:MAG: phosphatase PAP2 family protein [Alphaproteobacteria bacterium]|nr:MAG: phosphatase PAP2 family protein [Alphaproteobacteria bacterium]
MSARARLGESANYFASLGAVAERSIAQLVRPPSHSRRALAARRLARHSLLIGAMLGALIIALMYVLDAREIGLMPTRGTPSLWPVRILTEFGKDSYVLLALGTMLLAVAVVSAALPGSSRAQLLSFGMRLQFLFLAVLTPLLVGEALKWAVGRGRPFVGGAANAFNFAPFAGTEAFASFPSAHAVTAFALAFAVSAVWPRARLAMIVYAFLIAATRLVLLSHHPSDVVAGALIGVVGAMSVRYWFAARRLGFAIRRDGKIVPLRSVSGQFKGVARRASAP